LPETSRAVFLSYASQDAEAARKICEALRAAGIEVWFDKSELRGGDAWDQSIRRQIKNCALLIPVISRHTHERAEGYFRLEWKLAVDRSHLIMANKAFLLPVVIDDIGDEDENVPDKFREVQWTRLPAGETPPAFVERIERLLSGETVPAQEFVRPGISDVAGRAPAPHGLLRRGAGVWFGAAAIAVLLVLGYLAFQRFHEPKSGPPNAASIAVLPLANESGETNQQYFSDGISEDLITALSKFQGLKVIGRSSAFKFRDSKEDSRSIGAKLGVAHLLEGTVRKSGNMIRVSAELIDTSDGSTQWSERYDRAYKDLFALQDEITHSVAQALKTKLLPGTRVAEESERPPSGDLEAYNALLQGRFYAFRFTEADLHKAIEFFKQATTLDPRYALAWSLLSRSWTDLSSAYLEGAAAQEAYAEAREAADRALELAPNLPEAYVARGSLHLRGDFDWHGAEADYRRALALAPNDSSAKFELGIVLATFGDSDQAIELTRQAIDTEPLRAIWYNWLAVYLSALNRSVEAEQAIRKAIELQPGAESFYYLLSNIEVQRGDAQAALTAARQERPGAWQDISLTVARQIGTDRSAADAALKTLIEKDGSIAPFQIAQVYALRNDANQTFEWLDRAWSGRDPGVQGLLYDPFIQRFKDDPRFAAFCRKVGLPVPGN
jgi:TolB-like protein/Flp pilus assembly protein TadD